MAVVGLALVMTAVAFGGSLDPVSLGGPPQSAADGVIATGDTTTVTVEAKDMRFTPSRIEVPVGDRLVITVENTDRTDVHDLVLETGHDTGRLAPGESAVVDVGVIGRNLDGWCSVVGHKQMGMVLAIEAVGGPVAATDSGTPPVADDPGTDAHGAGHEMTMGEPADDTVIPDPVLRPLEPGRVHRHTFTVTEQGMEVAPGITQEMWTYNGSAPGPTLHGRVGDTFVIRLVNEGALGHSIDFHAGQRAPDKVMVTIPPGESLTYRFTATRAGIWMYHCSSMPMSAHIANGLFGAVVIDPPDLPAVDKSYVLVQSEHYYGPEGQPVDMDKLQAEEPDAVVFNGYHNAYDHAPLQVKVGERVRIWLLDAGPNRPLSFHVVGGQFDRTWFEGDWLLGSAAAPSRTGGSQALSLAPAQGGFVEMVFDEPGRYPLVNHVMIDAERGAHGVIEVTR
jgi:nitrite reductase (NO-forming)